MGQDYRKLKGSPYNIRHPHKLPELVFKNIQGNLDSHLEVTDQCGLQGPTLKRSILTRAVHWQISDHLGKTNKVKNVKGNLPGHMVIYLCTNENPSLLTWAQTHNILTGQCIINKLKVKSLDITFHHRRRYSAICTHHPHKIHPHQEKLKTDPLQT